MTVSEYSAATEGIQPDTQAVLVYRTNEKYHAKVAKSTLNGVTRLQVLDEDTLSFEDVTKPRPLFPEGRGPRTFIKLWRVLEIQIKNKIS